MSIKPYLTVLVIMGYLFVSISSFADSIHFDTANKEIPEQWWHGKVLKISDGYVIVQFQHDKQVAKSRIHVSRILSIYFDDVVEHAYPIRLSQKVEEPIPGADLRQLRRLYLFTSDFKEDYPEVKMYGPSGNKSIKGNIENYDFEHQLITIRARSENGEEIIIEDAGLFEYIRAWVR
jgi:hypothetical protein